jgi:hypothetical protein
MRLNKKEKIELRRLKSQIWYYDVLNREPGMTDYKLDIKFCWDEEETEGEQAQGIAIKRDGTDRLRAFENIRRNGSIPSKEGVGGRKFDLVERVDSTPGYGGTANLITSPLWDVLSNTELSLEEIREKIVLCVDRLGLAKTESDYFDDGVDYFNELLQDDQEMKLKDFVYYVTTIGDQSYDDALAQAISLYPKSLDQIALFALLALESAKAGNSIMVIYHLKIFRNQFLWFLSSEKYLSIDKTCIDFILGLLNRAINPNSISGMPTYQMLLTNIEKVAPTSAIAAFLNRHERLLWKK